MTTLSSISWGLAALKWQEQSPVLSVSCLQQRQEGVLDQSFLPSLLQPLRGWWCPASSKGLCLDPPDWARIIKRAKSISSTLSPTLCEFSLVYHLLHTQPCSCATSSPEVPLCFWFECSLGSASGLILFLKRCIPKHPIILKWDPRQL